MKLALIITLFSLLAGCAHVQKPCKPDIMIHEDISPTFHYQVWERENGERYLREVYRDQTVEWN